jgi:hypothetical protein
LGDIYSLSDTTIRSVIKNDAGDNLDEDKVWCKVEQIKRELREPQINTDNEAIVISSDSEEEERDTYDQVLMISLASSSASGGRRKSGRLQGQEVPR